MAILNVAFLNPKLRKASGDSASILSDRLKILESTLLGEGDETSVGDLDVLIDEARKIQNSGVLTAAQRSGYDVDIARYQQRKESIIIQRSEDVKAMDDDMKRDDIDVFKIFEDDPISATRMSVASLSEKINNLSEAIQKRENLGKDASDLILEKAATKTEWDRRFETMRGAESYDGKNKIEGQAIYIDKNSQGEVTNIKYAQEGSIPGYSEINAYKNGFKVYGKPTKENGRNVWKIAYGGSMIEFSSVDYLTADPDNPGQFTFSPKRLEPNPKQMGIYLVGDKGEADLTTRDLGEGIGIKSLQTQRIIPKNSWAKGMDGTTMYFRDEDGTFQKHLNMNYSPAGADPNILYTMSPEEEMLALRKSDKTIDHSEPIKPEEGVNLSMPETMFQQPANMTPASPMSQRMPTEAPIPTAARTSKPKEQAPQGILQNAQKTFQGGVDYLKNIFK